MFAPERSPLDGHFVPGPRGRAGEVGVCLRELRAGLVEVSARRGQDSVLDAALRREFGNTVTWPEPRGGFFLWASLPDAIDSDAMIARAVENGVIYVAGEAFFVEAGPRNLVRLAFSAPSHEKIREGVARFARTVREELAATATVAG